MWGRALVVSLALTFAEECPDITTRCGVTRVQHSDGQIDYLDATAADIKQARYRPEQGGYVSSVRRTVGMLSGQSIPIFESYSADRAARMMAYHARLLAGGDSSGVRFYIAGAENLRTRFEACAVA